MFVIFLRVVVSIFLLRLVLSDIFKHLSRFSFGFSSLKRFILKITTSNLGLILIYRLFLWLFLVNLRGNIPLNTIPTLFYSQTVTISLMFWVPIIVCVYLSQLKSFIAHMLPYGAPASLMLILPLIEIFSQLIRPFTLIIRLRTNLSRGHIIIYMFSYFTLLSDVLSPFITLVIFILFILEICISLLQAYIFSSLLILYINETC